MSTTKKDVLKMIAKTVGAKTVEFKSLADLANADELVCLTKINTVKTFGKKDANVKPKRLEQYDTIEGYMGSLQKDGLVGAFTLHFEGLSLNVPIFKSVYKNPMSHVEKVNYNINCRNIDKDGSTKMLTGTHRFGDYGDYADFSIATVPMITDDKLKAMYLNVSVFLDDTNIEQASTVTENVNEADASLI